MGGLVARGTNLVIRDLELSVIAPNLLWEGKRAELGVDSANDQ